MWEELNKLTSEKTWLNLKFLIWTSFFSEVAIVATNEICTCKKQFAVFLQFFRLFFLSRLINNSIPLKFLLFKPYKMFSTKHWIKFSLFNSYSEFIYILYYSNPFNWIFS